MRKERFSGHWLKLLRATIGTRWDLVVDMRSSPVSYLLRARRRRILRSDAVRHRVVHNAAVLGLDPPPSPKLWPGAAAREAARDLIPAGRTVLAVAPTANWPRKAWPVGCFAGFVRRMTGAGGPLEDAYVMVEGGPGEREQVKPLLEAVPADRLIDHIGSDLNTAYACFERVRLFVGNDSGLMHLAAAAGAPTLGLFGPTRDDLYAPWGPNADVVRGPRSYDEIVTAPGYDPDSPETAMADLTVDKVVAAASALLQRTKEGVAS